MVIVRYLNIILLFWNEDLVSNVLLVVNDSCQMFVGVELKEAVQVDGFFRIRLAKMVILYNPSK